MMGLTRARILRCLMLHARGSDGCSLRRAGRKCKTQLTSSRSWVTNTTGRCVTALTELLNRSLQACVQPRPVANALSAWAKGAAAMMGILLANPMSRPTLLPPCAGSAAEWQRGVQHAHGPMGRGREPAYGGYGEGCKERRHARKPRNGKPAPRQACIALRWVRLPGLC